MDLLDRRGFRLTLLGLAVVALVMRADILLNMRLADPDMFWHIATGRWIVQHGTVPRVDVFSWWAAPLHQPWVAMEWLFGVLIYGVYSLGGYLIVYWFFALLAGAVATVVYALIRARGVDAVWAVFLSVVVMAGTLAFITPRPQSVTWVLVPLVALLLEKGRWQWALLVVLVGVNVHGGVWPIYVIVFAFYEFPKRWWLVAAAAVVTLINPNPVGVLLYPLHLFASPASREIQEWVPTVLWSRPGDLVAYIAVGLALHRRRIPWREALFAFAFVLLSLSAVRQVAWFYVLVIPVLAPFIAQTGTAVGSLRLPPALAERLAKMQARRPVPDAPLATERRLKSALAVIVVGALALSAIALGARAVTLRPDVSRLYPSDEIIAYLEKAGAKRVFNIWHEGGYLIMQGIPPMIDGRFDPYLAAGPGKQDLAEEHMDVTSLRIDPRGFMLKMNVDYVLTTRNILAAALRHDAAFTIVASDTNHVLYRFDAVKATSDTP